MDVLQMDGGWSVHPKLAASTEGLLVTPVMTPEMAPVGGVSAILPEDDTRTGVAYTGTGISSWQPANCGYCA